MQSGFTTTLDVTQYECSRNVDDVCTQSIKHTFRILTTNMYIDFKTAYMQGTTTSLLARDTVKIQNYQNTHHISSTEPLSIYNLNHSHEATATANTLTGVMQREQLPTVTSSVKAWTVYRRANTQVFILHSMSQTHAHDSFPLLPAAVMKTK